MNKETIKLVFLVLIAVANLSLVYSLLNGDGMLKQKRDFENVVSGTEHNIVAKVKSMTSNIMKKTMTIVKIEEPAKADSKRLMATMDKVSKKSKDVKQATIKKDVK